MQNRHVTEHNMIIRPALLAALLFLMLSIACPNMYVYAAEEGLAASTELAEIRAIGDPDAEPPKITADAAVIYSLDLDRVVYGVNEDKKLEPYSITKILTCYLALENLDPDDVITVSEAAAKGYENGTSLMLKEGEKISVRDLIYGTLMVSGNDAAYALGEAVSGSEKKFAALMNETAAEWGCENTNFVNANGWKNRKHYTTARDMAIIAKECFGRQDLLEISYTKEYTIPATNMSEARELENFFRYTMGKTKSTLGGKTGTWDDDDSSIVLEYCRDGLTGIIVLLKDDTDKRGKDAVSLMKFSNKVTPGFLVSDEGDPVAYAKVRHGEFTRTVLEVDGRTTAYPSSCSADDIDVEMTIDELEAPIKKGDKVGTYTVYVEGELLAEHALVAAEDIETGWLPSYLYISNYDTLRILRAAGAAAAVILLVVIIVRRAGRRSREEQYTGKHSRK